MEQWFEGKVALVTGAGDGIGRASALLFARRGARVVVTDVNAETGDQTVEMIRGEGGDAIFAPGDVTKEDQIKAFVARALEHYGRLDCALNNAGITHSKDNAWDDDSWQLTLDINLTGMRNCIKHQVPAMLLSGGGTIVNTSSTTGLTASQQLPLPAYSSSKHAVIGLTKVVALQYCRQGIRCNAIAPGVTLTTMVRDVMTFSEDARKAIESYSPLGRVALPEEMAEGAIWLASDKSSFVNAHTLVIDGGFVAQ